MSVIQKSYLNGAPEGAGAILIDSNMFKQGDPASLLAGRKNGLCVEKIDYEKNVT